MADSLKTRTELLKCPYLRELQFRLDNSHASCDVLYEMDFFVKEGYQPHETGLRETRRGTSDATYLYYTLGKLQILKLREDYRKMRGSKFSLQEFHDSFMKQGSPPIKIVRRAMLGNDSPAL